MKINNNKFNIMINNRNYNIFINPVFNIIQKVRVIYTKKGFIKLIV